MPDVSWTEKFRTLSAAGLILQASSREQIDKLSDLESLIKAANSSGITLLNEQTMSELLSIISQKEGPKEDKKKYSSQQTFSVENDGKIFGRQIAPVKENINSEQIPNDFISNKQLENLSVDARDIATEIEINFDVTGNSVTEGKNERYDCLLW